jgi:RNA polymerase sigma-70 factor (ECF subfamily)
MNATPDNNGTCESNGAAAEIRPKLLAVAYRMLGSVADAEDAVQDAFLRYEQAAVHEPIVSRDGWLVKATTRLCIDRLRQAKRRESYHGPWLPEPVPSHWEGAAADRLELAESLSMAFLVLLETLSPAERAAFLLREAFGYEFDEIATVLDKTPVNARQLMARARRRLDSHEKRFEASPAHASQLAERFFTACQQGDRSAIESMLAADATYYSDGGGKVHAAPRPLHGTSYIARTISILFKRLQSAGTLKFAQINGQLGAVFYVNGAPRVAYSVATRGGVVREVYSVINPDKLALWRDAAIGDVGQ